MTDLRKAALKKLADIGQEIEQEPTQWRDMVVVSLVREGIGKHKARELADHFAAQPEPVAKLFGTLPVYDTAAQPEPVACRFCHDEGGSWAWQCYNCGEIDDVQKPTLPAAQSEQEPTCPECKAAVLYECVACSSNNYPPAAQPPAEWELIKNILDEYGLDAIAFVAAWKAAQRPWQGLTDEDVNKESAMIASQMKLAFHAGMYVAQKILQERNT
jgi:hypothetical protein